ncbi:anaerobic ribonucleoside-triphosphate reductase [Halanaerobacter jeridensis]|uniref:Ribonucleoside-triphosphate reductase n=1 Tax=Halanaerobacter jeridensis TaxID=706427 RepID=A0A939BPN8_9FIRM|nr:anaerobic ribonucleoside-triphosphate reductase [Halanaerobacter jeridensis]MBM7557302.1 ribonucleoside-triphosphate reductase [Halanaerobacter jeridensis]
MAAQESERTKCQVYSRVVGFITPTENWNKGKLEEFKDRVTYDQVLEQAE